MATNIDTLKYRTTVIISLHTWGACGKPGFLGGGNKIKHKIVEVKKYIVAQCTKMTEDRKRKL